MMIMAKNQVWSTKNGNLFDKSFSQRKNRKEIADMFKIVRMPEKVKPFFNSLRNCFKFNHHSHFQTLVVLMAFSWGRRNISHLCRHLDPKTFPHRTRFNNFFNVGRWDPQAALRQKAMELLAKLKPQKGDVIEFIIDDTKKLKRGKAMDAVNWIYDPTTKRKIRGHQYVTATLRFKGHSIPFGIRLYVKVEDCCEDGIKFKKTTQMAAELIKEFEAPEGVKVRVLFDSFYFCHKVVKACKRKSFRFVTTLASNRNLFKNGRKLKVGCYGKGLHRRGKKKSFILQKTNRKVRYMYVDAGWLTVGEHGRLHVVFSRQSYDNRVIGLVTDDPDLRGKDIISSYSNRWSIEVFFKDGKQLLGLGQYQNLSYKAAVTHLHLVCFAYALLTHIAITGEGAQGKLKSADRLSTGNLQDELRKIVWDDMSEHLRQFETGSEIIEELGRLLVAA